MAPTNQEQLLELVYANKLLAKTLDEVDEKAAIIITKIEALQATDATLRDLILTLDKKIELMPLVIAGKLEDLVQRRTAETFEDLRTTLDEMRNKLWAIKKDVKQVKDGTGSHQLPSREMIAKWEKDKEAEKEDSISVKKGGFFMKLPISAGALKAVVLVGKVIAAIAAVVAAGGGIWALIDRLKHVFSGGG